MFEKDPQVGQWLDAILDKYPQHKRALFLQAKYNNNETLMPADLLDLKRIFQALK